MLALTAALALAVPATHAVADGHVAARTDEGRRVTLTVRQGAVVRVRVEVRGYRCETFGELGPVHADERGDAAIRGAARRFSFAAGEPAQRLTVKGRFDARGRARGVLRVRGTIATGRRCASKKLAFGR